MKRLFLIVFAALLFSGAGRSQSTPWQWINPLPQGNLLNGVWAINANTAIAVGDLGTILRTTNGGSTWNVDFNAAGIVDQLFAVQFVSDSIGWVAGESGRIMKTTNGGLTWIIENAVVPYDLYAISFISQTTGWACGFQGTMLKTTDGGTTWTIENSTTGSTLYSLFFSSATNGWAAGVNGTIARTTDGGATWSHQTIATNQPLFSVAFTSPLVGFTVGAFGLIYKTTNGGTSWAPVVSGTNLSLYGLQFTSTLNGWACGEYGSVIRTTNGGASWLAQMTPTYNDLFSPRFVSSTTGWAVGDLGTILRTTDGGTTWISQSNGVKELISAISFPGVTTGYAVGDVGTIVSTTDAGMTWNPLNSGTFQNLYGVYFLNTTTGFAVGDSANILKTTNGGATWLVQHSHTDPTLYSVHFVNATTGWTVGDLGTILATKNAGVTWLPETAQTFQSLLRVKFANTLTGWAVGYGGTIIKTTNGGTTWINQNSGTPQALYSLEVIDANTAYAGGDFGTMIKTTNGGATWLPQATSTDATLYGLTFYSPAIGWAVGDDGTIASTTDGGANWSLPYSPTTNTLFEVQVLKTSTGGVVFASGLGGTIICSAISPLPIKTWTGAFDSLWSSPGNWNPAGLPTKADSVVIPFTTNSPVFRSIIQQVDIGGLAIAAGAKLTIRSGLANLLVKGSVSMFGTLEIDPAASLKITVGGNFSTFVGGTFIPGNSTIIFTGRGQIKGSFNSVVLRENANMSTLGNVSIRNSLTVLSNLNQRSIDTLTMINPDPGSLDGPAFVTAGTIKRAIRHGSTSLYRFESPVTSLQFYPVGVTPDTVSMTAFPNTLPPGLPDSMFARRYYLTSVAGGSNYEASLSLRYDSAESPVAINDLSLFRDSSGVIFNLGSSDFLDSDVVAVSLDSVRSFSKWYLGRYDFVPVHPFAFLDTLTITDHGNSSGQLLVGAQAGATDGIDPAYGEAELAPTPSAGTFDVRWVIPPTRGTTVDIRNLFNPSGPQRVYTFTIQPGPGGYPFAISWNKSGFATGTFLLQDQATQGGLISVSMKLQSSLVISNSSITTLQIVQKSPVYYTFNQSWNLIAFPLTATGNTKRSRLFPSAGSPFFGYSSSYYISDTMRNGVGYWIKLPATGTTGFEGLTRTLDTISIADGWNLIGSISNPVARGSIVQIPPNIVSSNYFSYSNAYSATDSIRPSKGYWVKARGAGKIVLSSPGPLEKQPSNIPGMDLLSRLNQLKIDDRHGHRQTLYFGRAPISPDDLSWFELPPPPPGQLFDARFSSGSMVQLLPDTGRAFVVRIQSESYPVSLSWTLNQAGVHAISVTEANSGAQLASARVDREGSVDIGEPAAGLIGVHLEMSAPVPRQFSLRQNYPNPFNPTTSIEFDLPVDASVSLTVYNPIGQEVAVLSDHQKLAAGTHTAILNATSLGSGVYFYRMEATGNDQRVFRQVRKLIVLK
jgi:photosystem II stability/assembly factor-like uncharacterized protein